MDNQYGSFLVNKIDAFMRHHVEPFFDPESIRWWFSLSGGKDSFSMASAVQEWYQLKNKQLCADGFHISQWSGECSRVIPKQLGWLKFHNVDALALTQNRLNYKIGDQAPCRDCSNIRRELNDQLIRHHCNTDGKVNFLARGLHLTDTVISLLWRRSVGYNSAKDLTSNGKGNPLSKLWDNTFLVKPLCYAREFETQAYAKEKKAITSCCGCPACKFPSRRDIVEETIAPLFKGDLWEFSTPDLKDLFSLIDNCPSYEEIYSSSARGKEDKYPHLPPNFVEFSIKYYTNKLNQQNLQWLNTVIDKSKCLDSLGMKWLRGQTISYANDKIPMPSLLKNKGINASEASLISSLGPFWGAAALPESIREKVLLIQKKIFGLSFDNKWTHSNELVTEYYKGRGYDTTARENNSIFSVSCTNNCISSN